MLGFHSYLIAAKCPEYSPGAVAVDGYGDVFDCPMIAQNAEHVEDIVAVVGEGEWVDDGVVVDYA